MRGNAIWLLLLVGCAGGAASTPDAPPPDGSPPDGSPPDRSPPDGSPPDRDGGDPAAPAPAVIVLIGDGMGRAQLDVSSQFAHGAPGQLAMQGLPHRGEVRTGGPSGITDSAAAATVMATGVYTYNGNIGVDRAEAPVPTVLERAAARGWATGIVTTTSLPHATPAGFTAHVDSRAQMQAIADQQVRITRPDVMLGGGAQYYTTLAADLAVAGYTRVDTADQLSAAVAAGSASRLFGAFADDHLTYVSARPADTAEPMLDDLALAAVTVLDRDPDGFFLMIEGGRIDHAGHANNLIDNIGETLAFDDTVAQVAAWARARGNTTVIVTADHECGGLQVVTPAPAGSYPEVTWRWGAHTNARVGVFAEGPGTEVFDAAVVDHRWVYEVTRARIDGDAFVTPAREPIPDGELGDLRHRAAIQAVPSGFGAGFNQLDALWIDASVHGLHLGVEGVFEWGANAVQIWIDVDPGAATGPAGLAGAVSDATGAADAILAASRLSAPAAPGFGADLALISVGGADPHIEDLVPEAGLRGLRAPYGEPDNLGWHHVAINYGAVRTRGVALAAVPGQGMEAFVAWRELYPGGLPVGARVAVSVALVNGDGGYTSNQLLPAFVAGTANPGRALTPMPGVVLYDIDRDADGVVDGDLPPIVAP